MLVAAIRMVLQLALVGLVLTTLLEADPGRDYSGISVELDSAAGPLSVLVAQVSGGNQLVHSILREFVFDVAWYVPPFVGVALLLATYSIRRSLRPLRTISAEASAIGPGSISIRLPEADGQPKHCRWSSRLIVRSIGSNRVHHAAPVHRKCRA